MKKTIAAIAVIAVVALVGFGAWYFLNPQTGFSGNPKSLTIGIKHAEANALIYIAEDRGFFTEDGLDVTTIPYTRKLKAFDTMVDGDADIAIISEYPIVAAAFEENDWIASHLEAIDRSLKSLDQAVEYLIYHPADGKAIVQKKVGRTEAEMATKWPRFQFSLNLDQSLIFAMEDEGRWMINNYLTLEKVLPNYLDYVYTAGLEREKPGAVNIIR